MAIRGQRKGEHLSIAGKMKDGPCTSGFEDIILIQDSVPELNLDDIDTSSIFLGKRLESPLIVNALTGGTEQARKINKALAAMAEKYKIAMAVGSQTIALEEPDAVASFTVVREVNPEGIILANISAARPLRDALEAVSMISANGLQIHFNIPQELAMNEGDRCFKGILENVKRLVDSVQVPVIAKEVGFGFSREAAEKLFAAGVRHIDNGGKGGTNFLAIENQRKGYFNKDMLDWGIPTAVSLAEIVSLKLPVSLVASGGIRTVQDTAKAIALGADQVGITAPFLKTLLQQGEDVLHEYMQRFLYQLKAVFLMCGASNCREMQKKPLIILGDTAAWLQRRGIDLSAWAQRSL